MTFYEIMTIFFSNKMHGFMATGRQTDVLVVDIFFLFSKGRKIDKMASVLKDTNNITGIYLRYYFFLYKNELQLIPTKETLLIIFIKILR